MLGKDVIDSSFFVKMLDYLMVPSWSSDVKTGKVLYGQKWADMLGYDISEISQDVDDITQFVFADDVPIVSAELQKQINRQKEFYQIEFRMVKKDNSIIWVQEQARVLGYDDKGNPTKIVAIAQDLTSLKEVQSAFSLSEEFFKIAVNVAELGLYDFDLVNNTIKYNNSYLTMLGYEPNYLTDTQDDWQKLVHPDDLPFLLDTFHNYLNGDSDKYLCEVRFKHKNGDYIWLRDVGNCVEFDADGNPTRFVGGHFNIDLLKRSQQELEDNKMQLEKEVQKRTVELVRQDEMLWTVNEIARNLLATRTNKSFDAIVNECLYLIGKVTGQSRMYIWKNVYDDVTKELCCSQIYELVNGTFSVQDFKMLEKVPYKMLPYFYKAIETGTCLNNLVCNLSEGEKEVLVPQAIKTILIAPINIAGKKWGFIGIDNCNEEELFSEVEENMLLMSGFLLASAIEKRQIEYERNIEEEMSRVLFESSPLCCKLWDKDFNLISCNSESLRLFGFTDRQEFMSKFFELSPDFQPDGERSKEKFFQCLQKTLSDGRCKIKWMHKNLYGDLIPTEKEFIRIKYKGEDAVAAHTRDLREVLAAQEQVREVEERNQLMLNASPIGSVLLDVEGNILDCNDAVLRMFSLKNKQELMTHYFKDMSPMYQPNGKSSTDLVKEYMSRVFFEGNIEFEWMHQNLKGEQFPVIINLLRIKYKDTYAVVVYISDQRKIKAMLHEIQVARDEALEHSKAKSDFLAKMSHEIRTPMNAIVGMTELLLREDISKKVLEYGNNIKQAGANLLSIINDILDFSKIESGRLEIVDAPYLLSSLINDVVSIIRVRLMDSPIGFVVDIDPNLPNALYGDEARIRQAVLNVLGNAVKYTKEGHISLKVYGESVAADRVLLKIQILDTGLGIREEDLKHLFQEFSQFDFSKNKGVEGTGLGLAIAKSFCIAMGGDISVQSTYGEGSVFEIAIPQILQSKEKIAEVKNPQNHNVLVCEPRRIYAQSISNALTALKVKHKLATMQSEYYNSLSEKKYSFIFMASFLTSNVCDIVRRLHSKTQMVVLAEYGETIDEPDVRMISMPVHSIFLANALNENYDDNAYSDSRNINIPFIAPTARALLVDDIATNLKVAEGLLAPFKLQIDTCESGYQAIELVKQNEYDIIFMDHMMPGMDGIETTLKIRQELNLTSIPIIALTANAIIGVKEMFLANGFDDFLSKPIEVKKLSEQLETWLPKDKQEKYVVQAKQEDDVDFAIEDIDIELGVSQTGGSAENYVKVLHTLYKDGINQIKEISRFLQEKNLSAITNSSHALKSALATIGAVKLSEIARKLEQAGKNDSWDYIKDHTPYFLKELDILITNIGEKIHTDDTQDKDVVVDENQIKRELTDLKTAIENLNALTADRIINSISKKPLNDHYKNALDKISEHLLISEYDEAVELIDKLIL